VAEHASRVLLALAYNSLLRMGHMHNFVCHLVKSEMSMSVAAPPLVLLATLNNRISTPEKLVALVGRDVAQPFAVLL
jgi:cytochrome c oxidase assembly factor CtaG